MKARTSRRLILGTAAALVGVALTTLATPDPRPAAAEDGWPGQAGIDTSLPPTESAVTVQGRGAFADIELTVNQTQDLTNQSISITWSGAPPTVTEPTPFHSNFVQVMQCWGEPDDLVPENPGPPPEQCVWGALISPAGFAHSYTTGRAFTNRVFPDFDPDVGTVDEDSGDVYRDFRAVDGTVVTDHVNALASNLNEQYWLNPYFDAVKTNELPGVRTLADGRGQALFTVNTGLESSGLGCGQRVQPNPGGGLAVPRCWLVIVPRSTPEIENEGLPFLAERGVASSPLGPGPWRNRIAVELGFTPLDSSCDLNTDQRQINGTELALGAVASWQPVLCTQAGLPPYAFTTVPDQLARQQLLSRAQGAPGMIAVNRPLPEGASTPEDPIVYAPLTVSAVSIGFNAERISVLGGTEDLRLQGVRYARMNLTPRLLAKLLTQSYRSQVEIQGSSPYEWDDDNPINLFRDPDFLQFNPEYELWQGSPKHAGGLILPSGTSDVASQVWEWILADPEAAAWLAGDPDEWGMAVNPVYATKAENNSTGFPFGDPVPDSFPKSDPYCYQAPPLINSGVLPPQLCGLDWLPYASGLGEAARRTAVTNDGARTTMDFFAGAPHEVWKADGVQQLGRRTMIALTDLVSSSRFGLQSARLSRAGDNGPDREFVAPEPGGLSRAVRSMTDEGGLLRLEPAEVDAGAYPLTTLSYAAVRPLALDAAARDQYAAFLDYAAGPGQVQGFDLGELPVGYLPLPSELAAATSAAADRIRTLQAPAPPSTSSPTTTTSGEAAGASAPLVSGPAGSSNPRRSSTASSPAPVAAPEPGDIVAPTPTAPASRGMTPVAAVSATRYAVVVVAVLALASALLALEITKRPRRTGGSAPRPSTP